MSGWKFNMQPLTVPKILTKYRKIVTKLPVPESLKIFKDLEKFEARSMHGQLPVVWDKASDFQVFDKYGNTWIDFTSTIFVANSGHGNKYIIKEIQKLLNKPLLHTYTFANENRAEFLRKLVNVSPAHFKKAFLVSSGTEATECAVKLMRMYGEKTAPNKKIIISIKGGMHGRTMGAEMLKGDPISSGWIGYTDPNIYHLPFPFPWQNNLANWKDKFFQDMKKLTIQGLKKDLICGFIIESYLGWGALFYPNNYIKAIEEFAKNNSVLLTFDEIQAGFARTGKYFAFEHYGVNPDLVCLGKGISSSLPLAAVLGRKEILDIPEFGSMSSTHSGNPLCSAAGLANLEFIESNNLVKESKRKGDMLHKRLIYLRNKFPHRIFYIGGKGLVASLILKNPKDNSPDNLFASKVCEKAMQKGLLLVHTGRESIKIGPPLTISDDALNEGIDVLEEVFSELNKEELK